MQEVAAQRTQIEVGGCSGERQQAGGGHAGSHVRLEVLDRAVARDNQVGPGDVAQPESLMGKHRGGASCGRYLSA